MMTTEPLTLHRARWWSKEGGEITCVLCPHRCHIAPGEFGLCQVRTVREEELWSSNYGQVCVSQFDAIEKKPMFHFEPGARIYSVGSFGCNLTCDYCQNMMLSHPSNLVPSRYLSPSELVREASEKGARGIAFTFNEPTVWAEYITDVSEVAHAGGLFIAVNTNGYIETDAGMDLFANVDAVKVDIKGFADDVYQRTCGGSLRPVLDCCRTVRSLGKHLELSYLMIPEISDLESMLDEFIEWLISELGTEVPVHLFRFQPAGRMSHLGSEPSGRMLEARSKMNRSGIKFVYLGGDVEEGNRDTLCPCCGTALILRGKEEVEPGFVIGEKVSRFCPSFSKVENRILSKKCPNCGEIVPMTYWYG